MKDTEKKTGLDWWCDKAWILFGCWLTAIMTVLIALNWLNWSVELKTVAAIAALIPVHVVEEWVFPGGFHFQYNTFLYHSSQPDRYPMCRKSDMITNLGATFMYMAITLACVLNGGEVSTGVVMGTIVFCGMELAVHTTFGTMAYFLNPLRECIHTFKGLLHLFIHEKLRISTISQKSGTRRFSS